MIGEGLIGGLIFALESKRPYLERGWMKQCKQTKIWIVQDRNNVNTRECGFNPMKHEVSCDGR